MLALLSPPWPSFLPENICTAVFVGAEAPHAALELLTARGRSAQMAERGCQETGTGWRWWKGGGGEAVAGRNVWGLPSGLGAGSLTLGHIQCLLSAQPARSWKSPCAKCLIL